MAARRATSDGNSTAARLSVLAKALQQLPAVRHLYFHRQRVLHTQQQRVRSSRLINTAVDQVEKFTGNFKTSMEPQTRQLPVLFVGAWQPRHPAFRYQAFLQCLAKKYIVVLTDEYNSTALCSTCGAANRFLQHPGHPKLLRSTVQCTSRACPTRGLFFGRDVNAAYNIAALGFIRTWLGGELG